MTHTEDILHYVWKFKLFDNELRTTDGQIVEVLDTGISNTDQGPDFFNAKVKIAGQTWVGNIEIHTRASDWNKHKHNSDKNYNSVILHIVDRCDCNVVNQLGIEVPQCAITYPTHINDNYEFLAHSDNDIACANYIGSMSAFHLSSWLNSLLAERLERKSSDIAKLLEQYNNSWEEVLYILLSRNFGFGLNSDSFERLARSIPFVNIQKQKDNIVQIEAMLFGQSGLINDTKRSDDYVTLLKKEYDFLANKFDMKSLDNIHFKKMRTRPTAFPQLRIAQLASLLHISQGLFSRIMEIDDLGRLRLLFHVNASEYWQTHYQLGEVAEKKSKFIGDSSLDIILINTVLPLMFSYGRSSGNEDLSERALQFLEEITPEKNSITKRFAKLGVPLECAADSQAIIQLKREYCELKKCLYCRIGHKLLTDK